MQIDIQFRLKNNPYYIQYIRQNSNWYKILNRDPNMFKQFEEEVKAAYKLRASDRISKAFEYMNMLETIISTLN